MDKLIVLALYRQTVEIETELPSEWPAGEDIPVLSPASNWQFVWRRYRAEDQHWYGAPTQGDIADLTEAAALDPAVVWLLLPSDVLVTRRLQFSKAERKHLSKLLPYQLEDQLVDDVSNIFVALGHIDEDEVSIAYADRTLVTELFTDFDAAQIDIDACLPLGLCLNWAPAQWSIALIDNENEQAVVRWAEDQAFGVDLALLAPALEALVSEQGWPEQIAIIAETETDLDCLRALIPEGFNGSIEPQQRNVWQALSVPDQPAINLRQGTFARRLPIQRWWREWRTVAYASAAALLVYLGVNWAAYSSYSNDFDRAQVAIREAYRSAVPNGALVDAERQLKQQLAKYETVGESGVSLLTMLQTVGPVLANSNDIALRNLSFVAGDMRLNLEAKNFQQLEQVRSDLAAKQMQAELLNVSRTGDGQQARLRVRNL